MKIPGGPRTYRGYTHLPTSPVSFTRVASVLLGSLLFAALPTPRAWACEGATSYRVFPLGLAGDDLVAARLIVGRGGGHEKDPVTWGGTMELVRMSPNGQLRKVLSTERVSGPDKTRGYEEALRPALVRAHQQARKTVKDFRALGAPTAKFCDVSAYCRAVSWATSSKGQIALDVNVGGRSASKRAVVVPQPAQEFLLENPNLPFAYDKEHPFIDVFEEHRIVLNFGSVRAYTRGDTTVFVVHLTAGVRTIEAPNPDDPLAHDFDMVNGRRDKLPKKHCKQNQSCMYYEPTPYHSTGFDVVITVPSPPPSVDAPKPLPREGAVPGAASEASGD